MTDMFHLKAIELISKSLRGAVAVSYTHLEALSGACCGLGETLVPMITTLLTICLFRVVCILPVSYTHLDVYKRQVQTSRSVLLV